ncbi:hypothetical protein WH243_00295 [Acinetobacter sp. MYb177]|uniref:hypothetical protein n=1 Tax=unclassified Acinetobacter TaxID=196816 RepID=UPI00309B7242
MVDFLSALQIGINSAANREANFIEIHNVFILLREQINTFSGNKIDTKLHSIIDSKTRRALNYFEDQSQLYFDKRLHVSNQNTIIHYLLTEIYFDRDNGYPCTILVDGDEYTATNKESLEENIQKLLSSPSTGSTLYSLMKKAP